MYEVQGEIYKFIFEPENITIHSDISGTINISIKSNLNEDFSIFDLGPYIAGDIELLAASAKIGDNVNNGVYLHVTQDPIGFIKIDIRKQPANIHTDPIDSGERIYYLKDYIRKIN